MSFLRYHEGAIPGKKRKVVTEFSTTEMKKKYEEKRERTFKQQWLSGRPWLVFDDERKAMFCSACKEFGVTERESAFVRGTGLMRIDGIKFHELSEPHKKAVDSLAAKDKPLHETTAAKSLVSLKKADHDSIALKLRNAHAVAKHSLSFRTYNIICALDQVKGLPIGTQYRTDKAAAKFCESVARITRSDVVDTVKNCSWCSITCDGSTDFTGDDMETVYVRTCKEGTVKDMFLQIGTAESASSKDIFDFILAIFSSMKINEIMTTKLVGFCADGASNMQGARNGLAALLKGRWPHLVTTHCLAHRLELAFKDSIKRSAPKLYEKATTLLLGMFYLFRKSPKQKKGLQRAFEAFKVKQKMPTRIGGTRWLPHYMRALNIFTTAYRVFRYHLENSSHENPKAEGLAKLIRDGHLIVFILSLKRIISNLKKLSEYLQKDQVTLADAYARVSSTKTTLAKIQEKDSCVEAVAAIAKETYQDEKLVFKGRKTSNLFAKMTNELICALDSRFFPTSDLIEATMPSSLKNWPKLKPEEIEDSTYGDNSVRVLFEHFENFVFKNSEVTVDEVVDEWSTLRDLVYKRYSSSLEKSELTWERVMGDLTDSGFQNIFTLIDVALALPPTSVKCETAFSAMKLLKTKRRGRLTTSRLNDLMTIKIMSPGIDVFNPEPALADWMVSTPSGQRRRIKGVKSQVTAVEATGNGELTNTLNGACKDKESSIIDLASEPTDEPSEPSEESSAHVDEPAEPTDEHDDPTDEHAEHSDEQTLEDTPDINQHVPVNASTSTKSFEDSDDAYDDDEDDDDSDNEMTEDTVFSFIMSFRE